MAITSANLTIELNNLGIIPKLESKEPSIVIEVGDMKTKVTVNLNITFSDRSEIKKRDSITYNTVPTPEYPTFPGDDGGEDSEMKCYIESLGLKVEDKVEHQDYKIAFDHGHYIYVAVLKLMEKLKIGPTCESVDDMLGNESLIYYGLLFQSFHPLVKYMESPETVFAGAMRLASNHSTHYLSTKVLSDHDRKLIKEYHRKYFLLLANDYRWQIASCRFDQLCMMEQSLLKSGDGGNNDNDDDGKDNQ